ncbi:MAG: extracellular solute-binding protein [Chloroflexi bacterium]|nr:extracellular solute-binding protein [Chloroflexota bacterium]
MRKISNLITDHKLSRRQFLISSGTVLSVAVLAACAPAGQAPAAAPADAPAAGAAAAVPTPTVGINEYGKADKPVLLWHGLGGADGATFAKMLEQYAKENEGVAVRSETYAWDVFFQKFPTAVAAGTPPDWVIFHAAEVPQMAGQGLMTPLDDIFFSGDIPKEDFSPAIMSVISSEGKAMAVPFDNHGWLQYVNTKVIKDAGLDPEKLPTNGAEFLDFALKVTTDEAGKHPNDAGFNADKTKVWAIDQSWPRFTIPSTLWQFGGGTVSEDQKKSLLDSEQSMAAIQYWHDLMYKHKVVRPQVPGMAGAYDIYKTNSLAIMWDGTWSLNFFNDNPDIAPPTSYATGLLSMAPDGKQAVKIDSHIMSIPTGVKEDGIERAKKLIKWLSDNGKTWATSGQIPARLSVQKDPAVQGIWSVKAAAEAFNAFGHTEVPHKAFIEIQTAWETAVSGALTNTTPVDQALKEGAKQIQDILDRP